MTQQPAIPQAVNLAQRAKAQGMTTLSGAGQKYPLAPQQQEVMCLLSDMTLLVRSGSERSGDVLSYVDLIKRKGARLHRQVPTTVTVIREMYEVLAEARDRSIVLDSQGGTSAQQIDVIRLIQEAVKRGASDIHLNMWGVVGAVFFRIHGDLYRVQELPTEKIKSMCSTIYQSMCDIADATYRPDTFQDARLHANYVARCGLYGSRIAAGPTVYGPRMVIRLLYDPGKQVPSLEELGYLPEQIEMFDFMRSQTYGINILSGATGSGKSTTLVSNLTKLISDAKVQGAAFESEGGAEEYVGVSVVTIEDPPEYDIEGAVRIPLKADKTDEESIRRGWANAIKACMRQDPDSMMIGEIRDPGSAKAAFDAAMTGHGVWTTVHVTDAVGIMPRLQGLEVETDRMLDPEIVTGLANMTLVQKLCPDCSIPWEEGKHLVASDIKARVESYCDVQGVRLRRRGHECPTCGGVGIVGRMAVAEVIIPDLPFMEAFGAHGKAKAKDYWVREMGGITKCMAAIRRINEGWVDPRQAEAVVSPLDKDKRTMGIDYSKAGDFERGKENIRPRHFNLSKATT
jgi:type II secretory ATPase GspE/PulE/Tfp pilus assembly ATPase PilB-like protein